MRKKLVSIPILAATLMFTPISKMAIEASASTVSVVMDGNRLHFDQQPIIYNDFTLVPVRGIFETLGATLEWDDTTQKIIVKKDDSTITLTVNSKYAMKDGLPITLDVEPINRNGRIFVPLAFVSKALGAEVKWDSKTRTVLITTESKSNEVEAAGQLTLTESIQLALANSYDLSNAKSSIERSEEIKDVAADSLTYTPVGHGNGPEDAMARSALLGSIQADLALQMSKKQVEIQTDMIEYNVKRAYNDILLKQEEKRLAELSLDQLKLKLDQARIMTDNGMSSKFDLQQAENNYEEGREKVDLAQKALDLAYLHFNELLGLPKEQRDQLADIPVFSETDNIDVDHHVRKVITESSAVWLADKQIELAQIEVDLYTYNPGGVATPYRAKEIDAQQARNSAANTKKQLEESVRALYNNMKQLENQYAMLQVNEKKAEEAFALLQARYDIGMATGLELAEAKHGLAQINQQMFNLVVQLDNLKASFEKPWVLSGM